MASTNINDIIYAENDLISSGSARREASAFRPGDPSWKYFIGCMHQMWVKQEMCGRDVLDTYYNMVGWLKENCVDASGVQSYMVDPYQIMIYMKYTFKSVLSIPYTKVGVDSAYIPQGFWFKNQDDFIAFKLRWNV